MPYKSFNPQATNKRPLIYSVLLLFALLIIIGISFLSHPKYRYDKNQTYIDNLSDYAIPITIPFTNRDELYRALNAAIRDNSTKQPPFYGGVVREDSYQYYSIAPFVVASRFIVDLPTIEQSYSVYFTWSIDDQRSANDFKPYIELSCVPADQNIYSNFSCTKPQPFYPDRVGDPKNYLPFTQYDTDNSLPLYVISASDEKTLDIAISTCNNSNHSAKELETAARTWLKENTSIPLDEYKIQISTTCDGDAV